jgi:hypothetical protein
MFLLANLDLHHGLLKHGERSRLTFWTYPEAKRKRFLLFLHILGFKVRVQFLCAIVYATDLRVGHMSSSSSACLKPRYNLGMPNWDPDCEVEQAYELHERADVARDLGEDSIAELFEQAARLAMAKAEVLQALDKLGTFLARNE